MYQYKKNSIIKLSLLAGFLLTSISQAQVCRVSTSGTNNASGSSWQQTKNLQSALNSPVNCPEIWVKSGVYYPTAGTDRNISFSIKPGVEVYGGFYGTETTLTQRDYLYNKAILSGDIGVSNSVSDNSYHVVYLDGSSATGIFQSTIIDGFIIRDGYADNSNGGGLNCYAQGSNSACSPILRNLVFRDNVAKNGGAIYNQGYDAGDTRPVILNVQFINNRTLTGFEYGDGGAIFNDAHDGISSPVLENVEFINNSANDYGGAISNQASSGGQSNLVISRATFSQNTARIGGAISVRKFDVSIANPTISNSTFNNNLAQEKGGAIYSIQTNTNLKNVTLAQNNALSSGGAVYAEYSNSILHDNILWENLAPSGSQVFVHGGQVTASYNVIENDCSGFGSSNSSSHTCSNILISNPQLETLQNNRGFTQTMMPGVGSSAIDSGDNNNCESTDQRGIARPQNGQCDIGAVEVLNICRVTTSGSIVGNGSNWTNQAMSLQTALNTANCHQVWIKTGTYKPTTGTDRSQTFSIKPKITVIGGFAGTETRPNDRDPAANPVILSGDIGVINHLNDNSYHVVTLDGTLGEKILSSTVLIDLEIHSGYSSESLFDFPHNSGAGLYCNGSGFGSACNPYLENIKFLNNHASGGSGGGLFNNAENDGESSPLLSNVIFENNSAVNGGAIYNFGVNGGNSHPYSINNQFINNSASNSGGAVYNNANAGYNRSQYLLSHFTNNTADYGGAVYCAGQFFGINTASFNKVNFTGNQASFNGGALFSAGWNEGQSKPTLQDVTFTSNSAQRGGALFLNDLAGNGTAELNRVTFHQNLATNGGAIYNDGENGYSHPRLTNVTFQSNLALSNGGAIYNNGNNGECSPDITNATFKGNNALYGGAMYSSADPSGTSSPVMRHVIMWDNSATTDGDTIYHNLAESNLYDSILEFGCPNFGTGNTNCNNVINSNPLLGQLSNNGGFTQTILPESNSPAIDAGNDDYCPGEDQRGLSRPNGLECDMGSVEVDTIGPTYLIFKNGFESL